MADSIAPARAASAGPADLSPAELDAIRDIVYRESGITLHEGKKQLVTARLQKRLKELGLTRYTDYVERLKADTTGDELTLLLDAISTNFTSFFREAQHFELLRDRAIPELRAAGMTGLRLWCAASATGEEPYTLAMTCRETGVPTSILASDISTKALSTAERGVYSLERVRAVPPVWVPKYFDRGMGAHAGFVRLKADIRAMVAFRRVNLLTVGSLGEQFQIIFCRNVMIYFDRPTQQRVVSMLERHLAPGGYLFIAHSESLTGLKHGLTWVAPAAFKRGRA